MPGKHDSIVKALFANTEDAASALASALPKEIAERIDWTSLRHAQLEFDRSETARGSFRPNIHGAASGTRNFVPSFRFFLDDLSVTDDEALRARSLTTMMRACLVLLKKAPKSCDVLVELGDWLDVFVEISRAPNGVDALRLLMEYISTTSDAEPRNIQQFARLIGPVAEDAYMTSAEQLTQQVREESLKEGLKEGRREGRREGQAELLLRLLSLRFGELPRGIQQRVHAATATDLARWAERVLGAQSLDEVLADD